MLQLLFDADEAVEGEYLAQGKETPKHTERRLQEDQPYHGQERGDQEFNDAGIVERISIEERLLRSRSGGIVESARVASELDFATRTWVVDVPHAAKDESQARKEEENRVQDQAEPVLSLHKHNETKGVAAQPLPSQSRVTSVWMYSEVQGTKAEESERAGGSRLRWHDRRGWSDPQTVAL